MPNRRNNVMASLIQGHPLISAAQKNDVPIIASLVETNLIDSKLSAKLERTMPPLTACDQQSYRVQVQACYKLFQF